MSDDNELKGLGGWLILVGLGVTLSPVILLVTHIPIYKPIFEDGTWELLTTAGSEFYHPLWGPLLLGEIAYNTLLVLASCYLIYLFYSKHYLFPKAYIVITVIALLVVPLNAWLVTIVAPSEAMFDAETLGSFVRAFVSACIWVPYMIVSKRVAATFVERMPARAGAQTGQGFGDYER